MRPRVAHAFGAISFGLIAAAAGCSLITSYDGFSGDGPLDATSTSNMADGEASDGNRSEAGSSPNDAGDASTTGGDGGPAASGVCFTEIPNPPMGADNGQSYSPLFGITSALYVVDDPANICPLGLDINGGRQCQGDAAVAPACANVGSKCQQSGNHDDTAKFALTALSAVYMDTLVGVLDDAIADHQVGLLVTVANYDSEIDDAYVDVALSNVVGADDGGIVTDVQDQGRYNSLHGYVSNGVLFADFSTSVIPVRLVLRREGAPDGGVTFFQVAMNDVRLVASIAVNAAGTGITLTNGQLTGRVRVQDFITTLGEINGCGMSNLICDYLDVPTNHLDDGEGDNCTATTFSLGFQAIPALRSGLAAGVTPMDFCPPDQVGTDDGGAPIYADPDASPCP